MAVDAVIQTFFTINLGSAECNPSISSIVSRFPVYRRRRRCAGQSACVRLLPDSCSRCDPLPSAGAPCVGCSHRAAAQLMRMSAKKGERQRERQYSKSYGVVIWVGHDLLSSLASKPASVNDSLVEHGPVSFRAPIACRPRDLACLFALLPPMPTIAHRQRMPTPVPSPT